MYIYIYMHMYIYMYVYICIYIYIYMYVCDNVYIYIHVVIRSHHAYYCWKYCYQSRALFLHYHRSCSILRCPAGAGTRANASFPNIRAGSR